jgi:Flp pilus assembly pilin Flp
MSVLLKRFLRDESGAGVEEAVLVTGLALVTIPSANDIGARLSTVFDTLAKALK